MATNNFLQFCPTSTGTNLDTQVEYAAATDRTSGNQPGVARSKLVNKALRQSTVYVSQLAQFIGDTTGSNQLDDGTTANILGSLNAALTRIPVQFTKYTSGSTTHNMTYVFFIAAGAATAAATYTNNGVTYTVKETIAAGTIVYMTGNGDPTASGTLTKASGTGDTTLTFYAKRKPIAFRVKGYGGGGGGGSGGASSSTGTTGADTTFGTSLLSGSGGVGGQGGSTGGIGGAASLGTGPVGFAIRGNSGGSGGGNNGTASSSPTGGTGAPGLFGGCGEGGAGGVAGANAIANSGAGGGGGGGNAAAGPAAGGGGQGGVFDSLINSPLSSYAVVIGAGGAGASGSAAGGNGGSGAVFVWEDFQ